MASSSNSNSTVSVDQGSHATFDELHNLVSLQQLKEKNLKLTDQLLDLLHINVQKSKRAQMEQKQLISTIQNSEELDAQTKEYVLRYLEALKHQSMFTLEKTPLPLKHSNLDFMTRPL
ncbi:hypothetical protein R1flu_017399 [Riccia fluitans]|uniref:Uncharacterized protein n=1 Tax=Riccia fluitans TaxID=41844 RepID=A0ABD1ZE49_9MARC